MPIPVGQIVRYAGLLMEMYGLSSFARANGGGSHWFGLTSNQVWTIVAVGFAFWLAGTIINVRDQLQRRERMRDGEE